MSEFISKLQNETAAEGESFKSEPVEFPEARRAAPVSTLGKLNEEHRLHADRPEAVDEAQCQSIADRARELAQTLDSPPERAAANRIARFWAAELARRQQMNTNDEKLHAGASKLEFPNRSIAEPTAKSTSPLSTPQLAREGADKDVMTIRLIAMARQWRNSGNSPGYLLWGDALEKARKYSSADPDVADLVAASDKKKNRSFRQLAVLSTLIAFVAIAGAVFAERQRSTAVAQTARANDLAAFSEQQRAHATAENERNSEEATAANAELARVKRQLGDAQIELAQQRRENVTLKDQVVAIGDSTRSLRADSPYMPRTVGGTIESMTPTSRWSAEVWVPGVSGGSDTFVAMKRALRSSGYDRDFLTPGGCEPAAGEAETIRVELPVIGGLLANLVNPPMAFRHFSALYLPARRMPVLTASNICRSDIQGLGATMPTTELLPPDQRAWYSSARQTPNRIVSTREITWGESSGALSAADAVENIAPFTPAAAANWIAMRRYAVTGFNPIGSKVTVFSGPVLRADDPVVGGIQLPRAHYLVLVGLRPGQVRDLVVEAYLLPHDLPTPDGIRDNDPAALQLLRRGIRSRVTTIEALAGLTFPAAIGAADSYASLPPSLPSAAADSPGTRMAATVPRLDDPSLDVRRATTQALIGALRDDGLGNAQDQRVVIEALLTLLEVPSFSQLTPNARVNLSLVLSEIPPAIWNRADMRMLRARARRASAEIALGVRDGRLPEMKQALAYFEKANDNLGFALGLNRSINVSFAVMSRSEIEMVRSRLQAIGWYLPRTNRSESTIGINEVRYGSADTEAAQYLVADIEALGYKVQSRPDPSLPAGQLSIALRASLAGEDQSSTSLR